MARGTRLSAGGRKSESCESAASDLTTSLAPKYRRSWTDTLPAGIREYQQEFQEVNLQFQANELTPRTQFDDQTNSCGRKPHERGIIIPSKSEAYELNSVWLAPNDTTSVFIK